MTNWSLTKESMQINEETNLSKGMGILNKQRKKLISSYTPQHAKKLI
jgi:hypothetical protein